MISCGGSDDEDRVADTIERYVNAIGQGDGETACQQLTPKEQREVAASTSQLNRPRKRLSCAEATAAFEPLFRGAELEAAEVNVDGDRATGVIRSDEGQSEEAQTLKRYALLKVDGE